MIRRRLERQCKTEKYEAIKKMGNEEVTYEDVETYRTIKKQRSKEVTRVR